jgi:hypothetical protein
VSHTPHEQSLLACALEVQVSLSAECLICYGVVHWRLNCWEQRVVVLLDGCIEKRVAFDCHFGWGLRILPVVEGLAHYRLAFHLTAQICALRLIAYARFIQLGHMGIFKATHTNQIRASLVLQS